MKSKLKRDGEQVSSNSYILASTLGHAVHQRRRRSTGIACVERVPTTMHSNTEKGKKNRAIKSLFQVIATKTNWPGNLNRHRHIAVSHLLRLWA